MDKSIGKYHYFRYSALPQFIQYSYRKEVFLFLKKLTREYPGFSNWYERLFAENNELRHEREIIICENLDKIVGVSILKRTEEEQKICTLRVAKDYQHQGIGKTLMEMSFEWLDNDKPLITLHKSKLVQFDSLFNYYGFELEQKKAHYYNLFGTELVYNGVLSDEKFYVNKFELIDYFKLRKKYLETPREDFNGFLNAFFDQIYKDQNSNKCILT